MRKNKVLLLFLIAFMLLSAPCMALGDNIGLHIKWANANTDVASGDPVNVYVSVQNDEAVPVTMYIEAGIFADSIARDWGLLSFMVPPISITPCGGESFVDAAQLTVQPGEQGEMILKPIAPFPTSKLNDGTSNWDYSHSVVVGLYTECGGGYHTSTGYDGKEQGAWSIRNINVVYEPIPPEPVTCGNGIIDAGEDCGTCPLDVKCPVNKVCTYVDGWFDNYYSCENRPETGTCIIDGDCDDQNIDTIDNCIGISPRHCSYVCVEENAIYDTNTGTCVMQDIVDKQLNLVNILLAGIGILLFIILIYVIPRRGKH